MIIAKNQDKKHVLMLKWSLTSNSTTQKNVKVTQKIKTQYQNVNTIEICNIKLQV